MFRTTIAALLLAAAPYQAWRSGTVPSNPSSGVRHVFADSANGDALSVRTAGPATVSLENGVPLVTQVDCAVSASYCTIWSYTPPASKSIYLTAYIIVDSGSTTVAPQFRVSSADAGYTGRCSWELFFDAVPTTTAPIWFHAAIGAAPQDTGGTSWGSVDPQPVELHCVLFSDASPGAILIEWQLETGTTPTQSVLLGSYYTAFAM